MGSGERGEKSEQKTLEKFWSDAVDAIRADDARELKGIILAAPGLKDFRGETVGEWLSGMLGDRGLLHMAALKDSPACLDYLVKDGWDIHETWAVDATSGGGCNEIVTPLSLAVLCGNEKTRASMFESLISVASQSVEDGPESWRLAMEAAASMGDEEIMLRIRLHLGEDAHGLWATEGQEKRNLLHAAAEGGSMAVLDMIWEWDGIPEIARELDGEGLSPKSLAESFDHFDFAMELAQRVRARDEKRLLSDAAAAPAHGRKSLGAGRL